MARTQTLPARTDTCRRHLASRLGTELAMQRNHAANPGTGAPPRSPGDAARRRTLRALRACSCFDLRQARLDRAAPARTLVEPPQFDQVCVAGEGDIGRAVEQRQLRRRQRVVRLVIELAAPPVVTAQL